MLSSRKLYSLLTKASTRGTAAQRVVLRRDGSWAVDAVPVERTEFAATRTRATASFQAPCLSCNRRDRTAMPSTGGECGQPMSKRPLDDRDSDDCAPQKMARRRASAPVPLNQGGQKTCVAYAYAQALSQGLREKYGAP